MPGLKMRLHRFDLRNPGGEMALPGIKSGLQRWENADREGKMETRHG
jgi:hypothetical protein